MYKTSVYTLVNGNIYTLTHSQCDAGNITFCYFCCFRCASP